MHFGISGFRHLETALDNVAQASALLYTVIALPAAMLKLCSQTYKQKMLLSSQVV